MIRNYRFSFFTTDEIKPSGWLRRQLEIQAAGLAGNLDKVWPDVRDSAWIGGPREGWERVPYWLDGFIPLAYLLDDDDMIARAKKYIEAIMDRQQPDGWICPSSSFTYIDGIAQEVELSPEEEERRAAYDTWAVLLISKVLMLYFDCSKDQRAADAAAKALKNLSVHLDKYPLFDWGKRRWYEGLLPIYRLYAIQPEEWLVELAGKLHKQGYDFKALMIDRDWERFKEPQREWLWEGHVVNYAMALKYSLLWSLTGDESNVQFGKTMLEMLRQYHGMATGHFTGDEILSGTSPIQGTELCSVVEAMFSAEINFAAGGDVSWLDYCEKLAFNALPAACSPDMWSHQYDQQSNQTGCVREEKLIWSTNFADASCYGLEPHYGCCTANFGQGWPKLALASFMKTPEGIVSAVLVPSRVKFDYNGAGVSVELATRYPFGNRLVYTVQTDREIEFELAIRIPGFAVSARIDGKDAVPGTIARIRRTWNGTTTVIAELDFETRMVQRPSSMYCVERGPLLFALPIAYTQNPVEYTDKGVERKFPYCDYETFAAEKWNFAFAGESFEYEEYEIGDFPFAQETPPVALKAVMQEIPWSIKEGYRGICNELPDSLGPQGEPCVKKLIPYGSTMLRMTEMPLLALPARIDTVMVEF